MDSGRHGLGSPWTGPTVQLPPRSSHRAAPTVQLRSGNFHPVEVFRAQLRPRPTPRQLRRANHRCYSPPPLITATAARRHRCPPRLLTTAPCRPPLSHTATAPVALRVPTASVAVVRHAPGFVPPPRGPVVPIRGSWAEA